MASQPTIDDVWRRIEAHEGEEFHTKRGLPLTYEVKGSALKTSRAEQLIGASDFEKALELVPIQSVSQIRYLVRGPAYVRAILHDPRIRQTDW